MTRRDANWLIGRAMAAAGATDFFARWMQAAGSAQTSMPQEHAMHSSAPPDPHDWSSYRPQFFSAEEFRIVDTFSAILIPTDETPGAREAHVAAFIDFVVNAAAEYAPEMQAEWRKALSWLVGQNFDKLSAKEQIALVKQMSEPEHDSARKHPGYNTYRLMKEMIVHAFYSSRVGLVGVLEYKGLAYLTEFPACTHPEHHQV
jgi:hypothetical protein